MLGRVLDHAALTAPRGPDGSWQVTVPASWMAGGRRVKITPPRTLECAACAGGGCDGCDRSGAVSLRAREEPPESFELALPRAPAIVRLPDRGGWDRARLARGHLLLGVRPGARASSGVELAASDDLVVSRPPSRVEWSGRWELVLGAAVALLLLAAMLGVLVVR